MDRSLPVNICALLTAALLFLVTGQQCNPQGFSPPPDGGGSGNTTLEVSPADQDITDADIAVIRAEVTNLPEPGTDSGGIHHATIIRWVIMPNDPPKSVGVLRSAADSLNATPDGRQVDTDPTNELSRVVLYDPVLDESGEVRIHVMVIRPTDRTEFGQVIHDQDVIAEQVVVIRVNNSRRLRLAPKNTTLPAAGTVNIKAIFDTDDDETNGINLPGEDDGSAGDGGDVEALPIRYEWAMSGLAGAGELSGNTPDSDEVTFTAGNEKAHFVISLRVVQTPDDGIEIIHGPVYAYVDVDPDLRTVLTFGYYLIEIDYDFAPGFFNATAYVYFPKIQGALSYTVKGTGITDPLYWGETETWSYVPDASGNISGVENIGGAYRFGLSSGGGPVSFAAATLATAEGRFGSMQVQVNAVVRD